MIARTLIEPEAIREAIANSSDGGEEVLTRLATELRRHGAIGLMDERTLLEALDPLRSNLKPAVANLWGQLLADLRRWGRIVDAGTPLPELDAPDLRSSDRWLGDVDLAIVSSGRVHEAGGGRAVDMRLSTPEDVDRSPVIEKLRGMKYAENYKAGTDSDQVWNERFLACAKISERVTLVDKYVFGGNSGLNRDLVPWILGRLEQDAMRRFELELIGALPEKAKLEQIRTMIADRDVGESRLSTIKTWVAPWAWEVKVWDPKSRKKVVRKRSGPHNRHIRFSCGAAFMLEEGFDRLVNWRGQPSVWGTSGVTPHYVGSDDPALGRLVKIEKDMKAATPSDRMFEL